MIRRFACSLLLTAGAIGWSAAYAQDLATIMGCDWDVGDATCTGSGGTMSYSNFMIAHRMERHSMVTPDGAVHIVVNAATSATTSTDALQLYTSTNGTNSWARQKVYNPDGSTNDIFGHTYNNSTSDLAVAPPGESGGQSTMTVIFNDYNLQAVEEAQLTWAVNSYVGPDPVWTVTNLQTALGGPSSGLAYTMPSYLAENQNNGSATGEFLAVMVANGPITQIKVFYNTDVTGAAYNDTGLSLPNPNNTNNCNEHSPPECPGTGYLSEIQHAPRLVYLPPTSGEQTVGLLYEAEDTTPTVQLYWEVITATSGGGWTLSSPVTPPSVGPMPMIQDGVDNSGFSVATIVNTGYTSDAPGTQYLAFLSIADSNTYVLSAVYTPSSGWGKTQALTSYTSPPYYAPNYVKLTIAAQNVTTQAPYVYVFFDHETSGGVYYVYTEQATTPFGSSGPYYSLVRALSTPAAGADQSYSNPRLDAPEYLTATSSGIPLWLQYAYDTEPPALPNSLLYWSVPVTAP